MKVCNKCNIEKRLIEFSKCKNHLDGLMYSCKKCDSERKKNRYAVKRGEILSKGKIYRDNNKIKIALTKKKCYQARKEYYNNKAKEWCKSNPEARREVLHKYNTSNKHKLNNKVYRGTDKGKVSNRIKAAKRRASKLKATPPWITLEQLDEIKQFYIEAKELQWLSEERLEVDHIIPLQGKNICGLHVPWNLQILPSSMNQSKGNK